jgi:hypothetical protein
MAIIEARSSSLSAGRGLGGQRVGREIVAAQQRLEQQLAAGTVPAAGEAQAAGDDVGKAPYAMRIAGRDEQALGAAGPADGDDVGAGNERADGGKVVGAGPGVEHVDPGEHGLVPGDRLEPDAGAADEHGEARARLAQRPFQKRLGGAGIDTRGHRCLALRHLGMRLDPGVDQRAREQELAGRPAAGNRLTGDEVVDRALLQPQIVRQLRCRHQRHCIFSRLSAESLRLHRNCGSMTNLSRMREFREWGRSERRWI